MIIIAARGRKAVYEEYNLFDAEGQQELHVFRKKKSKLGSGWMAFYKKPLRALLTECNQLSVLKVYLYIASKQTYQKCAMVTQVKIAEALNMTPKTVSEAVKWLKEKSYLQVHRVDGNSGFLLNPKVSLCGVTSKPGKEELWNLQVKKERAQLEEDIEKRKAIVEILDKLIQKNIYEGEESEYDEAEEIGLEPVEGAESVPSSGQ